LLVVSNPGVKLKAIRMKVSPGIVIYDIDKLKDNKKCRKYEGNNTRSTLKS